MLDASSLGFDRRNPKIGISYVGQATPDGTLRTGRLDNVANVTLKIGNKNVLVRSVVSHTDGSFAGAIYDVATGAPASIRIGEQIRFDETHVFGAQQL